jgi:segregation and condensation protein B
MEQWRGVSIGAPILQQLQEVDWITVVGHRDSPGRPALWATTNRFLRHFGLNTLDDLPRVAPDFLPADNLSNS